MKMPISLFLLISYTCIHTIEYIYPVIDHNTYDTIYMHQKDVTTRLFKGSKKQPDTILAPWYNPAYVQISPQGDIFSFIDTGRIHIKQLQKRAARALEPSLWIYNIRSVDWIDQNTLLVNAVYKNHFGIFYMDLQGNISNIITSDNCNLLFPQVCQKNTYYISIISEKNESLYGIGSYSEKNFVSMISPQNEVLSFLQMKNDYSGFVLSCDPENWEQDVLTFWINQLVYNDTKWSLIKLCSFSVPRVFLDPNSSDCFFEGMLPLLPKYTDEHIYFIDIKDEEHEYVFLYLQYDLQYGEISEQYDDEIVNKIEVIS